MYSVPVRLAQVTSEVYVDMVSDLQTDPTKQNGPFVNATRIESFKAKMALKPYDSRLKFTGYTNMILPEKPPTHEEHPIAIEQSVYSEYKLNKFGYLTGTYAAVIDLSPISDWIGSRHTAVLYGVLTVDPNRAMVVPQGDWQITVDLHDIFRWSTRVFIQQVGGGQGPFSWLFKYIGETLSPTMGKFTVGVKLFGQLTPEKPVADARISLNCSLTAVSAVGQLVGTSDIH